jgi:hypothetical protein
LRAALDGGVSPKQPIDQGTQEEAGAHKGGSGIAGQAEHDLVVTACKPCGLAGRQQDFLE